MLLFFVGFGVWHLTSLQSDLTASTALESAKLYAEAIATFRTLYTREVVERLRGRGIAVTHDYDQQDGAIPLPATLSMLLGKRIGESGSGAHARLYSRYPFPGRQAENRRLFEDPFVQDAWEHWQQNPDSDEPFYRFEEFAGRFSLRYAIADRMRRSCLGCHNQHPDTPKNDWKANDVRGVLEIVTPMDSIRELSRSALRDTFFMLGALAGIDAIGLVLVTGRFRHTSRILEGEVEERQRAEARLQRAHDELEVHVEQRTRELQEANTSLQADIVERKRAEESLRKSEERFDLAVKGTNDGIWDLDVATGKNYWSARLYELLGYEDEEISANLDAFQSRLHPDDRAYALKALRDHLQDRLPYDVEYRLRTKSGEYRWFRARGQAIWDETGTPRRMAGSIRDITDRKKAEQTLQDSEARLLLALDALNGGVWDWNVESGEVHFTESWCRMLGYEPGEVEGHVRTWENALHPDDKPAVMKVLNDHFEGRSPYYSEHRMRTKSGRWIWVLDRGQVVERDKNGKPIRMTGTDMNVTDRKLAEEEKRRLEAQVQQAQKLESLGVLAGGIAHDLNNTLTPIMGFTALVEESLPEGSPNRENLQEVLKSGERAKNLVRQILAFSRRGDQERKPVDIAGIVKEAMKLLRATIPPTIEICQNIDPECGQVRADATQIEQVIVNLCTNAYQALEDTGGLLEVSLTRVEVSPEDARAHPHLQQGPHVKLTVSDTGPGIDAAIVERIFEPFFTTKGVGEGTGLGLSIVHGIVTAHGGAISCRSEAGKGTSFFVYLPRLGEAAAGEREHSEAPPKGAEHILFVDDEESITRLAQQMLPALGYRVTVRTSGIEALEAFRAAPTGFDLVITDLAMPQLSGVDLARKLTEIRPDVPVLLCTGLREQIPRDGLHEIGIRGCVMKPFGMPDLAGIIRRTLDGQEPADV